MSVMCVSVCVTLLCVWGQGCMTELPGVVPTIYLRFHLSVCPFMALSYAAGTLWGFVYVKNKRKRDPLWLLVGLGPSFLRPWMCPWLSGAIMITVTVYKTRPMHYFNTWPLCCWGVSTAPGAVLFWVLRGCVSVIVLCQRQQMTIPSLAH